MRRNSCPLVKQRTITWEPGKLHHSDSISCGAAHTPEVENLKPVRLVLHHRHFLHARSVTSASRQTLVFWPSPHKVTRPLLSALTMESYHTREQNPNFCPRWLRPSLPLISVAHLTARFWPPSVTPSRSTFSFSLLTDLCSDYPAFLNQEAHILSSVENRNSLLFPFFLKCLGHIFKMTFSMSMCCQSWLFVNKWEEL